jgi:hypothetical protein
MIRAPQHFSGEMHRMAWKTANRHSSGPVPAFRQGRFCAILASETYITDQTRFGRAQGLRAIKAGELR